ncbi:MAG: hypothetical protein LBS73_06895, partial [Campylobacteraceae bacterium]|nr:hypothetical protein [Campylobacteraceae bacterium]
MNKFIKSSTKYDGIYHKVLANGDLSYYITYKVGKKKKWQRIGKASDEGINIAYCHRKRSEAINKIRFGDDTPIVKHKRKEGITFKEASEQYIKSVGLVSKSKGAYRFVADKFNDKRLDEITSDDIDKIKNTLRTNGKAPQTINNLIAKVRAVFNFAISRELFKGVNPSKKVTKLKTDNKRERYLSTDEVTTLKNAFMADPPIMLFLELSLSTGARLETVMTIKKKDINIKEKQITLSNLKAKNTYTGFINDSLLPLLEKRLKELKEPNDLIMS